MLRRRSIEKNGHPLNRTILTGDGYTTSFAYSQGRAKSSRRLSDKDMYIAREVASVPRYLTFLSAFIFLCVSVVTLEIFESAVDRIFNFHLRLFLSAVYKIEYLVNILSQWLGNALEKCVDIEAWALSKDFRTSNGGYLGGYFYPTTYIYYDSLTAFNTRMAWGTSQKRIQAHYARFVKESSNKSRDSPYRHVEVGLASPRNIQHVSPKASCLLVDVDSKWLKRGSSALAGLGYEHVSTLLHDICEPLPVNNGANTAYYHQNGSNMFRPYVQSFGKVADSLLGRTPSEQSASDDINASSVTPRRSSTEDEQPASDDGSSDKSSDLMHQWSGVADSIALNYVLHCIPGTLAPGELTFFHEGFSSSLLVTNSIISGVSSVFRQQRGGTQVFETASLTERSHFRKYYYGK